MKAKKLLMLFFLLNLFISCNPDDDNFTIIENYLIDGVWKLESSERFYYHDDEFNRSEITLNDSDSGKLTFKKDYSVVYESASLIENLSGIWELKENEKYLITDLSLTLSSSSGNRTLYFFPQSKIIEINKNILLLESMHDTNLFWSESTGNIKISSFVRSTFFKK